MCAVYICASFESHHVCVYMMCITTQIEPFSHPLWCIMDGGRFEVLYGPEELVLHAMWSRWHVTAIPCLAASTLQTDIAKTTPRPVNQLT